MSLAVWLDGRYRSLETTTSIARWSLKLKRTAVRKILLRTPHSSQTVAHELCGSVPERSTSTPRMACILA